MNRQGPYRDANANAYSGSQMQHMPSQRVQQNAGLDSYHGQPDSFLADHGNPYVPAQWDRDDGPRGMYPTLARPYSDARQAGHAAQSFRQAQTADAEQDLETEVSKRPRLQSHEQDMEIGYEDRPSALTFEVLQQKFQDEIFELLEKQNDAEDAEIARHRERIMEINNQYQEKLVALRAHQASRREESLCRESEGRVQQYRQGGMSNTLSRSSLNDLYGAPPAPEPPHQAYPSGEKDYSREQPTYHQVERSQATEGGRIPYPPGRIYNSAGTAHY